MGLVPEGIEYHIGSLPTTLLMTWVTWAVIAGVSITAAKRARLVPGKLQMACEMCLGYVYRLSDEMIGPAAPHYYPLFLGIFISILVSNLLGLIPGLVSPTSDPNTTFALSILVFVYYNIEGVRRKGAGYFRHFFGPPLPWYLFPVRILLFIIETISSFARPFSLGFRLFCIIFAKEMLLGFLAVLVISFSVSPGLMVKTLTLAPLMLRPAIILLGLFVGMIQALIFLLLSISYVAGAIGTEE